MNFSLPRFLKTFYRYEPLSSFILIVGAVDAVIGGVGERWSLLSVGIAIILLAVATRALQARKATQAPPTPTARFSLPPSSEPSPLPILTPNRQRR